MSIQANFHAFFMLKQCADSILLSPHTSKQVKIDKLHFHIIMFEKLQLDLFMWIVVNLYNLIYTHDTELGSQQSIFGF